MSRRISHRSEKSASLSAAYSRRTACAAIVVAALGLAGSPSAKAENNDWIPTSGSSFWNVGANWSNGVPTVTSDVRNMNVGATIEHNTGSDSINSYLNLGIFILSGGDLTLAHDFTGSGDVYLRAALYGAGKATSNYNVTGQTWLQSGLISGFSIHNANLIKFDSGQNRIVDSTLDSVLDLSPDSSRVRIQGTTNLVAGTYNIGGSSVFSMDGDHTLSNTQVVFGNSNYGFLGTEGASTLTIASNSSITGRYGYVQYATYDGSGARNLINNGLISQNVSGGSFYFSGVNGTVTNSASGTMSADGSNTQLYMNANSFVNNGALKANNGGYIPIYTNDFASTGSVSALNGGGILVQPSNAYSLGGTYLVDGAGSYLDLRNSLTRGSGTITTSNGGIVYLGGTLDNTGHTFNVSTDIAGTHNFLMRTGIISGGSIVNANLLKFDGGNNRLNNVTLDSVLDLTPDNSRMHLTGTTALVAGTYNIGANSGLSMDGDRTLTNTQIVFGNSNYGFLGTEGTTTLTIAANSSVTGRYGYVQYPIYDGTAPRNLINNGLISANVAGANFYFNGVNGTVTNGATGTMSADGAGTQLYMNANSFNNQGALTANNGGYIPIYTNNYASTGSVSALNGSGMTIQPNNAYSLDGTYLVDGAGSYIDLRSSLTRGGGTITTSNGGIVYLSGTLDNTGHTFNVTTDIAGTHNFLMNGGTITGGSITNANLLKFGSNNNRLNNVVLDSVLNISSDNSHVHLTGTTNLVAGTYNIGASSALSLDGDRTLSNTQIVFGNSNYGFIGTEGASTLTVASNSSITGRYGYVQYPLYDGSGARNLINNGLISANVAGANFYFSGVNGTVTNNSGGTMSADGAGAQLYMNANSFVNNGTLKANNSGYIPIYTNDFASTGNISVLNGGGILIQPNNAYSLDGTYLIDGAGSYIDLRNSLTRGGGTITTSNGGIVYLSGALDNTGHTFNVTTDIAGTHNFLMNGGTITGGSIVNANLLKFGSNNNRLNNVTLDSVLDLTPDNSHVHLTGTTNLVAGTYNIGSNSALSFDGDRTLTNTQIVFGNSNYGFIGTEGPTTLTVGATSSITGRYGYVQYPLYDGSGARNLINNGLISANVAGANFYFSGSNGIVTNSASGTMSADGAGAQLYMNANSFVNNGTLKANNGGYIPIYTNNYTSTGSVSVLNASGMTIQPTNAYSLDGTYLVDGAGSYLDLHNSLTRGSGTITTSNGGIVYLGGTLDNTGHTFNVNTDIAGTHNFLMNGGTITGGSIVNANLLRFGGNNNRLDNVALDTTLDLSPDNSHVHLTTTTTPVAGTYNIGGNSALSMDGNRTLTNTQIVFGNSNYGFIGTEGASTLTVASNSSITGRYGYVQYPLYDGSGTRDLINNGLISQNVAGGNFYFSGVNGTVTNSATGTMSADGAGTQLYMNANNFVNNGKLEAKNGGSIQLYPGGVLASAGAILVSTGSAINTNKDLTITAGSVVADGVLNINNNGQLALQAGTLQGAGAITGQVNNTGGTVAPGDSVGKLTINGSFAQGSGGILALEFGAAPGTPGVSNDLLEISGTAALNGKLSISFVNNFLPTFGDTYTIMDYASMSSPNLNLFSTIDITNGNYSVSLLTDTPTSLKIRFAQVPGPDSFAVMISGLLGMAGAVRGRRRRK